MTMTTQPSKAGIFTADRSARIGDWYPTFAAAVDEHERLAARGVETCVRSYDDPAFRNLPDILPAAIAKAVRATERAAEVGRVTWKTHHLRQTLARKAVAEAERLGAQLR